MRCWVAEAVQHRVRGGLQNLEAKLSWRGVCVCTPCISKLDGKGSRPAGLLSFAQPATGTLEFALS